jgi:Protein of unknown function (DUF3105)
MKESKGDFNDDLKDDEVVILPSLMSYRDTALHGFVPPSVGSFEAKARRRRLRNVVTGAGVSAVLIGVLAILAVQAVPRVGSPGVGSWPSPKPLSWQESADRIDGIMNLRGGGTQLSQEHSWAPQTYEQSPPVGGIHSPVWQQCLGNIYDAPIANEHAVHSMEHGAVWLTYRSDLPPDMVEVLKGKVRAKPYTFMSPYEGLDARVSLQTWGYQLKLDDVNDPRIDEFINILAENATMEPEASCANGVSTTGATPWTEDQARQRLGG